MIQQRRADRPVPAKTNVVGKPGLVEVGVKRRRDGPGTIQLLLVAAAVGKEELVVDIPILVYAERRGSVMLGATERKIKLLVSPSVGSAWTVRKESIFCATGLRLVILFPGNAVRHCTPPTVFVVEGSKISPNRTWLPSQGLITGAPLFIRTGPSRAEKSPWRSASVGKVVRLVEPSLFRYCSQEKKKKV